MGWTRTTIGEQVLLQRGFDITKATQRSGSIPVISSGGFASTHDVAAASGPGVVLGRKGVVGSVWYVQPDYWPHDTTLWVKDFKGNHPRFVYYFFKSMAPRLASLDVGSANPTLNRNHVHPTEVLWPSLPDQRAIASILGALDDKIGLNREMNKTLEELARTVFKSWFVDFEGRTEVVDTEHGRLPKGWSPTVLGDHVTLQRGTTYSGKLVGVPGPALLGLGSIEPGGGFRDGHYKTYGGECPEKLTLFPGDLFAALKGATKDGTMVGSIARVPPSVASGRLTQDTVKLEFKNPDGVFHRYLYWLLLTPDYRAYCAGRITGSAQVGLSREDFLSYPVPVPPGDLLTAFVKIELPLSQRKDTANAESKTLAGLRDLLLPRLISGEVRVPLGEKMVEAVL